MPAPHRPIYRTTALVLASALVLSGCGGGGTSSGAGESGLLTDEQATTSLLTQDNVGSAFAEAPAEDEDDEGGLGCLDALDQQDGEDDAPVSEERSFNAKTDFETPTVAHSVASFDTTDEAEEALEQFADALDGCTEVDEVDDEGTRTTLEIETDTEVDDGLEVDDQVNVVATGEISSGAFEFPLGLWVSAVRVDNHLSLVFLADLGSTFGEHRADYVAVATERLRAVIDGEEPPTTEVDAAVEGGSGDSEDSVDAEPSATESGDAAFEQLPLDGGTYTWSNGVTMVLSVERTEPWGDVDDFCGDGSCGVANRDDTRVVLRYEVTVPDDASEPFDASSCPGSLDVMSGNGDEALSGVAGDYDRELDGKIFPGQSKFGLAEYYIEKAYSGGEFYIESSCGDEFDGETAYFVGTLG